MNLKECFCAIHRQWVLLLLLLLVIPRSAAMAAEDGLLLEMLFDGTVDIKGCVIPSPKVDVIGNLEYLPGIEGKALVIENTPKRGIGFLIDNKSLSQEGTMSLWVCPLDWKYDDEKHHIFANALVYSHDISADKIGDEKHAGFSFLLYKYGRAPIHGACLRWLGRKQNNEAVFVLGNQEDNIRDWLPDKWHHLVVTWKKSAATGRLSLSFFLDGENKQSGASNFNLDGRIYFYLGACWGGTGKTALDNFRLYNRALPSEAVSSLYDEGYQALVTSGR
ncbi:MAG: hypothetical protein PHX89_04355 [bacterium]|nr:hypothetical protein [bacterium]